MNDETHSILPKIEIYKEEPPIINCKGTKTWYFRGKRHREGDLPAVIWSDGTQLWYINGKEHRENDQPALIYSSGGRSWYINGKRHREGDKPAVIRHDGTQLWYIKGKLHRLHGPAAIWRIPIRGNSGTHELDELDETGNFICEWYINGKQLSRAEHTLYVQELVSQI